MPPMKTEFSTFDVMKALGIPRERLKDWMSSGFIKPLKPAEGKGTKAIFDRVSVYAIALFRHLHEERGLVRKQAAVLVQDWQSDMRDSLDKFKVTTNRDPQNALVDLLTREFFVVFYEKSFEFISRSYLGPEENRLADILNRIEKITQGADWTDLYCVNFRRIRDEVDECLKTIQ